MENAVIKCRELVLVTNGTSHGTKVLADGKELNRLKSIYIKADVEDTLVDITIEGIDDRNNVTYQAIKFEGRDV